MQDENVLETGYRGEGGSGSKLHELERLGTGQRQGKAGECMKPKPREEGLVLMM